VFAAISEYEGQLAIFNYPPGSPYAANYRDVFPDAATMQSSCQEAGVLGVLPGIIGCMQCNESIKLITGIGKPLVNRILIYNALTNQVNEFSIGVHPSGMPAPPSESALEIEPAEFEEILSYRDITVIDVRESHHRLSPADFKHICIPLSELQANLHSIGGDMILTFCEKGILSLHAAKMLKAAFGQEKKIYSLKHGLNYYNLINRKKEHER
jgi:adenylyltransferase/sulfurtransferase